MEPKLHPATQASSDPMQRPGVDVAACQPLAKEVRLSGRKAESLGLANQCHDLGGVVGAALQFRVGGGWGAIARGTHA